MPNIEGLSDQLEKFKRIQQSEYDFSPIEKWMIKHLGVTKIETGKGKGKKKGRGPIRTYNHRLLQNANDTGNFNVHVIHKKKLMIRRINFRTYVYPVLKNIIHYMETEAQSE